jgi:hypothetical protein
VLARKGETLSSQKISLSISLFLLIAATTFYGQDKSTIKQDSDKSPCSNIVALAGNVNLNCSNLTSEQKKLIDKIPILLNRILVNQGDPKIISDKLDEILETLSHLNQPPALNYAPGGFATSGGTLVNPQVNNFRDPLPPIEVGPSTPIAAQPRPTTPSQVDPHTDRPGASVTVTVKGAFRNPAFVVDCDVPCSLDSQWIVTAGGKSSNSMQFQPLSRPDNMGAAIAYNVQMYPGFKIELVFRSLDDRPLTVSNVRPYDPNR